MTGQPDADPAVEAEAAGALVILDQLVHFGHHGDTDALFESVFGMDECDLQVVCVAAVQLLTQRDALVAYVRKLGWMT